MECISLSLNLALPTSFHNNNNNNKNDGDIRPVLELICDARHTKALYSPSLGYKINLTSICVFNMQAEVCNVFTATVCKLNKLLV